MLYSILKDLSFPSYRSHSFQKYVYVNPHSPLPVSLSLPMHAFFAVVIFAIAAKKKTAEEKAAKEKAAEPAK